MGCVLSPTDTSWGGELQRIHRTLDLDPYQRSGPLGPERAAPGTLRVASGRSVTIAVFVPVFLSIIYTVIVIIVIIMSVLRRERAVGDSTHRVRHPTLSLTKDEGTGVAGSHVCMQKYLPISRFLRNGPSELTVRQCPHALGLGCYYGTRNPTSMPTSSQEYSFYRYSV